MQQAEPDALRQAVESELSERYRIQSVLAHGTGGDVFLARDVAADHPVALKVLPLRGALLALGADLIPEFEREATLASSLRYSHLIPVTAFGTANTFLWYAMEYTQAPTLAELLRESGPLELNACFGIIDQIASALDYMHQRGVAHGGVRPTHIFVDSEKWARLSDMDIGSAVVELLDPGSPTDLARRLGYAAPEQFEGTSRGPMTDQYSLAVVAYECLAGHQPFVASTPEEVGRLHRLATPASLIQQRNDIPAHVDQAIRRALSKAPHNRFTKILDFASMLRGGSWAPERSPTRPASAVPLSPPRVLMGDPVPERFPRVARAAASLKALAGIAASRAHTRPSRHGPPGSPGHFDSGDSGAAGDRSIVRFPARESPSVRRTWTSPKWDRVSAALANFASQSRIAFSKSAAATWRSWLWLRARIRELRAALLRGWQASAPLRAQVARRLARGVGYTAAFMQRGWREIEPLRLRLQRYAATAASLLQAQTHRAWKATKPARERLSALAGPPMSRLKAQLTPIWEATGDVARRVSVALAPTLRHTRLAFRGLASAFNRITSLENGWSNWGPLVARGQLYRAHKIGGISVLVVSMVAALAFQPASETGQQEPELQNVAAADAASASGVADDDPELATNGPTDIAGAADQRGEQVEQGVPTEVEEPARPVPAAPPATQPGGDSPTAGDAPPANAAELPAPPAETTPAPVTDEAASASRIGLLSVNATPWGTLYVDGQKVGNTPKINLPVAPGTHVIRIERAGFEAYEQEIRVAAGERLRLTDIELKRER